MRPQMCTESALKSCLRAVIQRLYLWNNWTGNLSRNVKKCLISAALPVEHRRMVFKRFVEIGRVCVINYGPDYGKLCVIIDVLDQNRAFVDGPASITGIPRQTIPFKRLSLTDIKINIPRCPRPSSLAKAFKEQGVQEKWEKTAWARKQAIKTKRASLNDFDRFKVMLGRKERSRVINQELRKLVKTDNKKHLKGPRKNIKKQEAK